MVRMPDAVKGVDGGIDRMMEYRRRWKTKGRKEMSKVNRKWTNEVLVIP